MLPLMAIDLSESIAAEIAVIDTTGKIVRRNRKWDATAKAGGLSPKPGGWNYFDECEAAARRGCEDAPRILKGLRGVLGGETPEFIATYVCPFNERHHWFQIVASKIEICGQRHALAMHVDVSALQVDGLTGLPNRAMFDAQLHLMLTTARDSGRRTGVIFVDINRLKTINDIHGHQAGDAAIKAVATALTAKAGPDCMVTRIGGDEFGVVLPVSFDTLLGLRIRAHFKSGVSCSIGTGRASLSISASIGIALYPDDGTIASELLKAADMSMYEQKRGHSVA